MADEIHNNCIDPCEATRRVTALVILLDAQGRRLCLPAKDPLSPVHVDSGSSGENLEMPRVRGYQPDLGCREETNAEMAPRAYRLESITDENDIYAVVLGGAVGETGYQFVPESAAILDSNLRILWTDRRDLILDSTSDSIPTCHDIWGLHECRSCPAAFSLRHGHSMHVLDDSKDRLRMVETHPIYLPGETPPATAVLRLSFTLRSADTAPDVFIIDPAGRITSHSPRPPTPESPSETLIERELWEVTGLVALRDEIREAARFQRIRRTLLPREDGGNAQVIAEIIPLLDGEILTGFLISLREIPVVPDIGDLWFRHLVENAGDVIYRYRLRPEERFEYVSPSVAKVLGFPPEELITGMLMRDIVDPEDEPILSELLRGDFDISRPLTMRWKHRDGRALWVEHSVTPIFRSSEDEPILLEGIARDITRRMEMERELHYLSFHDSLTGLYNRAYFTEELARLEAGRDEPATIISTDIDGLKIINDTLGHRQGDSVIRTFADILAATFRRSDVVARVGGDEFAVILSRTDLETATELGERLSENIASHNRRHLDLPINVSIGIAFRKEGQSLEDTMNRADRNMYRNKLRRGEASVLNIINYLLGLLWEKEHIDEEYVDWLTDLAMKVGRKVNLSEKDLDNMALLTRIYDLGKVGVDENILAKPGPLSEEEWERMKDHSTIGHRLALSAPHLSVLATLVLHHHERWDGTGYPRGVEADEIPLASRILAVVDALGAMTRPRPYRNALPLDAALEEIKRRAGTHFDPEVVEVIADLLSSKEGPL